ncbi:MAG: HAMP domain-containing sensor histidine kinase, partial [Spirochaetaceae bacterium]|nr:HAMP domain-containing sensor histidine kinase [Spirochaetaceae bacterium]
LERVFYHDIANTVTGIQGIVNVARPYPEAEDENYFELLRSAATQLAEEVESHKTLKAAEDGALPLNTDMIDGRELVKSAVAFFAYTLFGKNIALTVDPASDRAFLETDPVILKRILVNMIKNAIEAAEKGESIVIRCSIALSGSRVVFTVRNRAVMPEEAKRLVFQRSFSTKGIGRGVGTYGMKLLAERYLKGSVGFSSRSGEGTVFFLDLPVEFPR